MVPLNLIYYASGSTPDRLTSALERLYYLNMVLKPVFIYKLGCIDTDVLFWVYSSCFVLKEISDTLKALFCRLYFWLLY